MIRFCGKLYEKIDVNEMKTELAILGAGPGGYTAAFRAADLGKKVTLIDYNENIDGVCLHAGCIPSKYYLHVTKTMRDALALKDDGIEFGALKIDIKKLIAGKNRLVNKLSTGLKFLAKLRNIEIIKGTGKFISQNQIEVTAQNETKTIIFEHAIIAAGSHSTKLPSIPNDPRIIASRQALELPYAKGDMLIIGGAGVIGLEMADLYHALGVNITLVDVADRALPFVDTDISATLQKAIKHRYKDIILQTAVKHIEPKKDGLYVTFEGEKASSKPIRFDFIMTAVGRTPNGKTIGAEHAGVNLDEKGFVIINEQLKTNVKNIYAIGDITGQPMLAHKASTQGHLAAEIINGANATFDPACIPSVCYCDPEIAWVGLSKKEAAENDIEYDTGIFPWASNGRSLSTGQTIGLTKLLINKKTDEIIGATIIGSNASELISEIALAIESGCTVDEITHTIHPHPTLSETIKMAAEVYAGTVTDLLNKLETIR